MSGTDFEQGILDFWKKNKIYEKSVKKNSGGEKFYMMDGPPYATGHIHLGTALNKTVKDIAMRMKRLQGCEVFDRAGYDTHGTPIELQVEKEIGSKNKKDIEKFGVAKFIDKCRKFATQHIDVMNTEFENLGVWMDWKNPYLTLSDEYIEAIWHAFKEADKKGYLYLGKYPVHICTRCETVVAYNEIEYGKQTDKSVFVKFPVKKRDSVYLLIWTTTPWTLPANTGVMVNPKFKYVEVETPEGEKWIVAKERVAKLSELFGKKLTAGKEFLGKDLDGLEYGNPLEEHIEIKVRNRKVVLSDRYVTIEDGTGLVHCAPGHGKEDYEVGKENDLDIICPVGNDGVMKEEAGKYSGKKALEVNKEIIEDLRRMNFLAYEMNYEHEYPLCWRDKTPLLMVAQPQWFLKISKLQKELMKENEKVNWIPDYMKLRMKAWLEGIGDWPISRQRYWGTPLPIWYDEKTGEKVVVGSMDELSKLSGVKKIDMHKPGIDEITIKGKKGKLKRIPEVLDVWFDAGVSSWAALGYPANKKLFDKFWPADFNFEGKDQFRGWWNSQLILSMIAFGKKPFENISVHGMILDISKKKMSKSLGNVTSPESVIEKYGRDQMRYYLAKMSRGEDFAYDEKEFVEIGNFFRTFGNICTFVEQLESGKGVMTVEDKWIISKYNRLVEEVITAYNSYRFYEVIQKVEKFVVFDLSRSYVQMIRERSDEVSDLMNEMKIGLLQLLAPIIPFYSEKVWQELREKEKVDEESVHLSELPKANKKKINEKLEKEFDVLMAVVSEGLKMRDRNQIGLKWPLSSAKIESSVEFDKDMLELIKRQLNVKSIKLKVVKSGLKVELDTKMTPELEAEGFSREIARKVQAERKNEGLEKRDRIELKLFIDDKICAGVKKHLEYIKERTGSVSIELVDKKFTPKVVTIRDAEIGVSFKLHQPKTFK